METLFGKSYNNLWELEQDLLAATKPVVTPPRPTITSTPAIRPFAIIAATQTDKFGHLNRVGWSDGNRYLREQTAVELVGNAELRLFTEQVLLSPGVVGPMPFGFTGVVSFVVGTTTVGTAAVNPTTTEVKVTFDSTKIADGWYLVSVTGLPSNWGLAKFDMLVRNGTGPVDKMLVVAGSYTVSEKTSRFSTVEVPAVFKPVEVPLVHRDYPALPTITSMDQLAYTMLAPYKENDVYRSGLLPNGVYTTANRQRYFYSDLQGVKPVWPLLSGPRGRGTIICPTSLRETGRGSTSGKLIGTDSWRAFAVDDDGTVRTLAGYEHDSATAPYANTSQFTHWFGTGAPRLVGDWTGIPQTRWGFHELWDIIFDPATTTLDPNAPPIGGEQPHVVGPTAYVTDTQNGRVCKLVFSPIDRTVPPKITEFIVGLNKPWGLDIIGPVLYVSEQGGNRVGAYDLATGALLWSIPLTRAEGLRAHAGKLYIGSLASKSVQILDPVTRTLTKFCDVPTNGNSNFVNVAVTDGTTGNLFLATVTWSNMQFGWPAFYDATGKILPIGAIGNLGYKYTKGTLQPTGLSYSTCVTLGNGRTSFGTAQEGLHRVSLALVTDTLPSAAVIAGEKKWRDLDLKLIYSEYGFGYYGVALPWGEDPDIDEFLKNAGHA